MPQKRLNGGLPVRHGRLRQSHVVALAIVGSIVLFIVGVVAMVLWGRDTTPPPTLAELEDAEARWQLHGPTSYDLDVETIGARTDRHHLEVRRGKPIVYTVNGHAPPQRRVWETWTVPRQFQYIRDDVVRPVPPGSSPPLMTVRYDSKTGLPRNYVYSGSGGLKTGWNVIRFEPIAQDSSKP